MKAIDFLIKNHSQDKYFGIRIFNQDCSECPFGELSDGEEENYDDPIENYFKCSLIGKDRVFGEDHPCTCEDWVNQLKKEVEQLEKQSYESDK